MSELKKYRFSFTLLFGLIVFTFFNQSVGLKALQITGSSIVDMLILLPPILIFVSLLDKWVKKETLIKYMGKKSGIYGTLFAFLLGAIAAGPLYLAFPIAVLLLKKGANIRYIVFFLGVWSTAKLHVSVYAIALFGFKFTLIYIGFGLFFFYMMGIMYEKVYDKRQLVKYDITNNVQN
ncbi:permease [Bacillus solimangrovi]|uniref:Permease n=1 Tax=Bacillus solimangrovi TaxID=1305675 RepID=A0A1E5LAK3_9BACI|nr:permease [Bacillus solimangrovi]OEH91127.1 hypothetical protein BFG57_07080 [Bacillus solimangrovi]